MTNVLIDVITIESAILASDCNNDKYLLDWRQGISYLVLKD